MNRENKISNSYLPEYTVWCNMRRRCNNKKHHNYEYYGDRGISVCDRWNNSFELFLEDMGKRPSKNHTIERINSYGNYEPTNCKWATKEEQARNKRNNIYVEYNGEKVLLVELAKRYNINPMTLKRRVSSNWDIEKALNAPLVSRGKQLTEDEVVTIRELYQTNEYSQRRLASVFRISVASVNRIINSKIMTACP